MTPTDIRLRLFRAGFSPLPLTGKSPDINGKGWQQKRLQTNNGEIELWASMWPDAKNTGVLCRNTPFLDLDILDPEAAEAAEAVVAERFDGQYILTRFGSPPKRAIPFQTAQPFKKISVVLIPANAESLEPKYREQKIEFLGDGQQCVVDGIHPDTGKPYSWHGGVLGEIARDDLPGIDGAAAAKLVDDIVARLTEQHGYRRKDHKTRDDKSTDGHAEWNDLLDNLLDHDKLAVLAMSLLRSGMSDGAAVNFLRAEVERLKDVDPDRRKRRLDEIPGMVASAAAKLSKPESGRLLIKTSAEFVAGFVPPDYILEGILQQGFVYSLTGATGAGKTSIALRLAASAALGDPFAGREIKKCRVLYLAAENPDDTRMRWIALAQQMDFEAGLIDVFFSDQRFTISKMMPTLRVEVAKHGGEFGLVIVDTGPAFFEGDDENSRAQMGMHAKMFRALVGVIPGRPCILVNGHPVKNATPGNLLPAGGGTFLNEMDGNLTALKTESTVELHWQGKFRGPEFAPLHFVIKTVTHANLKDKKGRLIPTCIAEWISEARSEEIAAQQIADETRVLEIISLNPKVSLASIAIAMDWKLYSGEPNKMRAKRCIAGLAAENLAQQTRDGIQITSLGKKALKAEMEEEDAAEPSPRRRAR